MRQRIFELLGKYGCYLFCIARLIEKIGEMSVDMEKMYLAAKDREFIEEDCFVREPGQIMGMYLGGTWEVRHEGPEYKPEWNEYIVERWELKKTGETKSHFVLPGWDPYGESETRKKGVRVSTRVFKRVG